MLKTFWKSEYSTLTFILKSGVKITVKCKNAKWNYNTSTGDITSYTLDGIVGPVPKYINCAQIAAIIQN
jgi:hypothetical protein